MLAAATRMLAINQLSAASWSYRVRSFTQTCAAQHIGLSGRRSFFGTNVSHLLESSHSCKAVSHAKQRRFQVFSIWGSHYRHQANHQGWAHTYNPCRGLFGFSRQKEEEEDRKALGFLARAANGAIAPPAPLSEKETRAYARELHTVNVAISVNIAIFFAKLVTYLASGSSAMLAESIHSLADIGNQLLLRTGIQRSKKAPSALHPYGYMKDKFVWSLISAVGIFCLGAGVTVVHGFHSLFVRTQLEHLTAGLTVLGVSLLLEGYSLLVAVRTVTAGAASQGLSFTEFVRRGMDPTSIAVMMEDGAACAGLIIAAAATYVTWMTGNSVFDAIGSISVGVLLGATAIFLIQRNRQLLIGRSMNVPDMAKVLNHLRRDPVVKAIYDAKSEEIGPGIYRFKAEIDFSGKQVVQRHMSRLGRELLYHRIEAASTTDDRKALELVLQEYGKDMVGALGAEVDRLENEVRELVPGLRHIDLETDRGGRSPDPRHGSTEAQQDQTAVPMNPVGQISY